jgi:uncharacterized protein YjbJ (UPF0337 family)
MHPAIRAGQRMVRMLRVHRAGGDAMNWDQIQGSWQEFKGKVRSKWAKLTDDDLDQIGGKREEFLGRMRQRYGYEKDHAERELDDWLKSMKTERGDEPESGQRH